MGQFGMYEKYFSGSTLAGGYNKYRHLGVGLEPRVPVAIKYE